MTALVASALLAPPANAQVGVYGTWVRYGDADYYTPITKKASSNLHVNMADFGNEGAVRDNCVILDTAGLNDLEFGAGAQATDLRLNPCMGKNPGTLITDSDSTETSATYTPVDIKTSYADVNSNKKYDKGETVYITTAASGIEPSKNMTSWTLRLTGYGQFAAGTFVLSGDEDLDFYAEGARNQTFGLVEREDKAIYLIPGTLVAKMTVPEKSLRMLSAVQDQPDVKAVSLELLTPELRAGEVIKVKATLENMGKLAGWGLATLKLDGIALDVAQTPVISPGERATVMLASYVPPLSGQVKLEVGDVLQFVDVVNDVPAAPTADEIDALVERLAALEAKLAALEESEEVRALEVSDGAKGSSPGPDGLLLLAVAGLALIAFRRRGVN